MWPWAHLAVAYLCYAAYTRVRRGRTPLALPALAVAFGSQFPDLVDKPLGWWWGIIPGGRLFAHTLLFTAVALPAVALIAARYDREESAVAFSIGHVSHVLTDVSPLVLIGDFSEAWFLFYPLVDSPFDVPDYGPIGAGTLYYDGVLALKALYVSVTAQFVLFLLGSLVWLRDGAPGLGVVRSSLSRLTGMGPDGGPFDPR